MTSNFLPPASCTPHPCHARHRPRPCHCERSEAIQFHNTPLSLRAQRSNPFFVFVFHNVSLGYCVPCAYPRICSNCAIACFHILGFIASNAKQSTFTPTLVMRGTGPALVIANVAHPCHCEQREAIQFSPLLCVAQTTLVIASAAKQSSK